MGENKNKCLDPVQFSYNPSFSSWNSVFLSQQISRNSISAYFFSEANGALVWLEGSTMD